MHREPAVTLLGVVLLGALALGCGRAAERPAEPPGRELSPFSPQAWTPPPDEARALAVISFAEAQVGKRYCWGGTGPQCFDCSGLVQAAWRWAGVKLPRTSDAQGRALVEVPIQDVRPGDILWWPGHVGLYVGGGAMIDAYHSRAGVVRRPAAVPRRVLRVIVASDQAVARRAP